MGHLSSGCHTCGKDCIDVEFCSEGASFDNDGKGIKLPKNLKVKIIANPDYWGFSGVLTSGYVTFNQGHYDYFEGYDENWWGTATCEDGSTQASRNEKRPDVTYRSVFDPDTGLTTHYDGTTVEDTGRGGAVSYLINRAPGQVGAGGTEDLGTCPEIDPTKSFKRFSENFGWANKINFDTSLFKNMTGAWRMVNYETCYDESNIVRYDSPGQLDGVGQLHSGPDPTNTTGVVTGVIDYAPHAGHLTTCNNVETEKQALYDCSGSVTGYETLLITSGSRPKQNLNPGSLHYGKYYDPARITVTGLNYLDRSREAQSEFGETCARKQCLPDGSVASEYAGNFMIHETGTYEDSDGDTQTYRLYGGGVARNSGGYCHDLAGMRGSGTILTTWLQYTDWANGGARTAATGLKTGQTIMINIDRAQTGLIQNWDYENGINNPCQPSFPDGSNTGQMDWLKDVNGNVQNLCGFFTIAGVKHYPTGRPAYTSLGNYITNFEPCSQVCLAGTWGPKPNDPDIAWYGGDRLWVSGIDGQWTAMGTHDPSTCCGLSAYGVDEQFKTLHCDVTYHSDFRRVFNDSKFKLQSNRTPANRHTYDYGTVYPHANVDGAREDKTYIAVDNDGNPRGTLSVEGDTTGYTSTFPRKLPYYGVFYDVDTCDSETRGGQKINFSKSNNATCFTKKSTLDVFPDCYTQYIKYAVCDTTPTEYKYKLNRVPRLSFVYRGCDFDDSCAYDESGRPYSEPTSIEDLRRGRGGEEIHMYINLGEAWSSTIKMCSCDAGGFEEGSIYHVGVDSPVTFPSFPDFDLNPSGYGCDDDTFQLANYLRYSIGSVDAGSSPDAGQLPRGFCDDVPKLAESCNVRQPYTTYGYMMNLCGKQGRQKRKIIEAFNDIHQSGTYTHLNPTGVDIDEPMYRGFIVPEPQGYTNGPRWQTSGALHEEYITETIGATGGYWGLRDVNGALIAPYYKTESGEFRCPGAENPEVTGFLNFSDSGNYIHGWPTTGVPFLIQIEAETRCVGCTTSMMEPENLNLNIQSLPTKYQHQLSHTAAASTLVGGMYGYQHCNQGGITLDATETFSCATGFYDNYCYGAYTGYEGPDFMPRVEPADGGKGDLYYREYGVPHTGETCPLQDGLDLTLYSYKLGSSPYPKGWQTRATSLTFSGCYTGVRNDVTGISNIVSGDSCSKEGNDGVKLYESGFSNSPYVKLNTDLTTNFLNEAPAGYRLRADGMTVYGKFGLGCNDMNVGGDGSQIDLTMPINMQTAYLDIASADAVRVSYGGQGCPGHYPTKLSDNRDGYGRAAADLLLYGRFWAVAPEYEELFEAIDPHMLRQHAETSDDILTGGRIQTLTDSNGRSTYNIFGLCVGDRIYKHGCFLKNGDAGVTMGTNGGTITINGVDGMFFGVSGAACVGRTLCNTCDKTDWYASGSDTYEDGTPSSGYLAGNIICDPECTDGTEAGFIGYVDKSGIPLWNAKTPLNYEFNNCYCKCKDPVVFAYYEVTGTSGQLSPASGLWTGVGPDDPNAYWDSMTRAATKNTGVNGCSPTNTGQVAGGDPSACNALGPFMINTGPPNHPNIAYTLGDVEPEDWFSYSHGVNKLVTGITHDLVPPRMNQQNTAPGEGCNTLTVKTCDTGHIQDGSNRIPYDGGCNSDPTNRTDTANCKDPIYNTLFNRSGVKTNVAVNRKACFPETMTVNAIECKTHYTTGTPHWSNSGQLTSGEIIPTGTGTNSGVTGSGTFTYYDLVVSREFYSHDRTWKTVKDVGGGNACANYLVGAYFAAAPDPADGDLECTGCTPIPYAVPSDLVTPVAEAACSVHPSTGTHVNQDFVYRIVGASETGTMEIRCDGVCKYTWLGSWQFNSSTSTCACSCSPPASGGASMGAIGDGTCS